MERLDPKAKRSWLEFFEKGTGRWVVVGGVAVVAVVSLLPGRFWERAASSNKFDMGDPNPAQRGVAPARGILSSPDSFRRGLDRNRPASGLGLVRSDAPADSIPESKAPDPESQETEADPEPQGSRDARHDDRPSEAGDVTGFPPRAALRRERFDDSGRIAAGASLGGPRAGGSERMAAGADNPARGAPASAAGNGRRELSPAGEGRAVIGSRIAPSVQPGRSRRPASPAVIGRGPGKSPAVYAGSSETSTIATQTDGSGLVGQSDPSGIAAGGTVVGTNPTDGSGPRAPGFISVPPVGKAAPAVGAPVVQPSGCQAAAEACDKITSDYQSRVTAIEATLPMCKKLEQVCGGSAYGIGAGPPECRLIETIDQACWDAKMGQIRTLQASRDTDLATCQAERTKACAAAASGGGGKDGGKAGGKEGGKAGGKEGGKDGGKGGGKDGGKDGGKGGGKDEGKGGGKDSGKGGGKDSGKGGGKDEGKGKGK